MEKPWTLDDCQFNEDQVESLVEILFTALEDTEYFDWLDNGDAAAFPEMTAAMIERALKDAHRERRAAALVALRAFIRLNIRAINEVRSHLEEE
jgi:hypothetical protein